MATRRKTSATGIHLENSRLHLGDGTTLDVTAFRRIVEILESSDIKELIWKRGNERLIVKRDPRPSSEAVAKVPSRLRDADHPSDVSQKADASIAPAAEKAGHLVTSPFVGTFYRAASPDQATFVEVGTIVKKGQVLCIIEAMKLMNEIESDIDGKVVEIIAQNAQPVEFGQPIFRLEAVAS